MCPKLSSRACANFIQKVSRAGIQSEMLAAFTLANLPR